MKVLFSLWILLGSCNIPPSVETNMIQPNAFMDYLMKDTTRGLDPFGCKEYPSDNLHQTSGTHGNYIIF